MVLYSSGEAQCKKSFLKYVRIVFSGVALHLVSTRLKLLRETVANRFLLKIVFVPLWFRPDAGDRLSQVKTLFVPFLRKTFSHFLRKAFSHFLRKAFRHF